jgi:hypothetical protein
VAKSDGAAVMPMVPPEMLLMAPALATAATLLEPRIEQDGPMVNRHTPGWSRWPFARRFY